MNMKTVRDEYKKKEAFLSVDYPEVSCFDMFRDIFPEESFERVGHPEDRRPNGFVTYIKKGEVDGESTYTERSRSTIVFDDLKGFTEAAGDEFCITNCVAYSGRNRTRENAYKLYGIVIDIDYVDEENLVDLLFQMEGGIIPRCTYLVNSGTGLHAYYVFYEPIPLYRHLVEPINDFKKALTDLIWNQYTSKEENKQFQSIFQGFRIPGSQSKLGRKYPVRAHKIGEKVDEFYLNEFVDEEFRLKLDDDNRLDLEYWKEEDPDWYERRIVRKEPPKHFLYNRGMYEKWRDSYIKSGAFDGNRYHCLCVLFANAVKCGIPFEEAMKDAEAMQEMLNKLTKHVNNQFTMQDVRDASLYYNEESHYMKANTIRAKTKIDLPEGKRHIGKDQDGRTIRNTQHDWLQADTVQVKGSDGRMKESVNVCKANRELALQKAREEGRITGRPKKDKVVSEWRRANPDKDMKTCADETGLSINTVKKWWEAAPVNLEEGYVEKKRPLPDQTQARLQAYAEMIARREKKKADQAETTK